MCEKTFLIYCVLLALPNYSVCVSVLPSVLCVCVSGPCLMYPVCLDPLVAHSMSGLSVFLDRCLLFVGHILYLTPDSVILYGERKKVVLLLVV